MQDLVDRASVEEQLEYKNRIMKLKLKYDELSERYQNSKLGNNIPLN